MITLNKKGLIISVICEIAAIIGFLYYFNQYQYVKTLTSNNIAANLVYPSRFVANLAMTFWACAIVAIIFLVLIIYFARK